MSVSRVRTLAEFVECLRIRLAVFVAEQGVPVLEEVDQWDAEAVHYLARLWGLPAGTARLVPLHGSIGKIGRVAVLPPFRRQGVGSALLQFLVEQEGGHYDTLLLDSQIQAAGFYKRLGFSAEGGPFMDAGIPHVRMVRRGTPREHDGSP